MSRTEELLVGIVTSVSDFEIIQNQHWYRIPTDKAERLIRNLGLQSGLLSIIRMQSKTLPQMIIHYAKVSNIEVATRQQFYSMKKKTTSQRKAIIKFLLRKLIIYLSQFSVGDGEE